MFANFARSRIGDGLRRLHAQMARCAVLTPALLEETPDEDILEVVLSNLWAKMAPGLTDEADVVRALSPVRQRFYAVYRAFGHIQEHGFDPLPPDAALALETLRALDAAQSAAALARAIESPAERPLLKEPFLEAFGADQVRTRLAAYVRANAAGFCDDQN